MKCVSIFSATFARNISHSKKNSARYHKCAKVFMRSTNYSVNSKMKTLNLPERFSRSLHISNITKIRLVGAEGFLADRNRETDRRKNMTKLIFYIHGFVHRKSILIRSNKMQQYAGIYLLQNQSTCFGCPSHPSSGVHKTVTAASGTGHNIRATIFLQCGHWPRWRKFVARIL